jgi:hypothetical protein
MNAPAWTLVAALVAVAVTPKGAMGFSDELSISDDASLDRSTAQYRSPFVAEQGWYSPCVPIATEEHASAVPQRARDAADAAQAGDSGDRTLTRIVAQYDRATLDRGGWENPFAPDSHYAAGNPLLAVRTGEGVTLGPAGAEPTRSSDPARGEGRGTASAGEPATVSSAGSAKP